MSGTTSKVPGTQGMIPGRVFWNLHEYSPQTQAILRKAHKKAGWDMEKGHQLLHDGELDKGIGLIWKAISVFEITDPRWYRIACAWFASELAVMPLVRRGGKKADPTLAIHAADFYNRAGETKAAAGILRSLKRSGVVEALP